MVPVPVRCRIPELLEKIGQTQVWLSAVTRISEQRISDYSKMRYVMSLKTAKMIARALKCSIDNIYVWEWREE